MKSLSFEAGSKHVEPGENTEVCMASFLALNGCISVYFEKLHLKLSTHAYFEMHFHSILSKYENSKNRFL